MLLRVVAVGRLKAGPERELVGRYVERAAALARPVGLRGPDLVELPEGDARRAAERIVDEGARLRGRVADAALVAFDERAPAPTSEAFAARLASWRDEGRPAAAFVIGGPDGLDPGFLRAADLAVSFGRLTLPHGIVRALVCEQIYRALTILAGHPYHRAAPGEP